MSDKAAKKRQFILDTAKTVFAEKGFKSVTMKDIVDACEISRGGLYIYFDSTEAIFSEILREEAAKQSWNLAGGSAGDRLAFFLSEQKKSILSADKGLSVALYEYMFYKHEADLSCDDLKDAFKAGVAAVEAIVKEGVESGEFYADDIHSAALNIVYLLEGLKLAAGTVGVSERDIDGQLVYILGGLIAEE